jgi:hypothetical protein
VKRAWFALLLVSVAFVGCTSGGDEDSLSSDAEARGWVVTASYPNGTERSYNVTSDPTETDTDGDGLDDFQELERGTDPRSIDTDEDRLLDGPTLCPDEDAPVLDAIGDADPLEHPGRSGCFLGEQRTEVGDLSYKTDPTDAHSDSSPQLSDRLADGTELVGWQVELADGETYHARSNPGLRNADTDQDGLHDGLERQLTTDPTRDDTDGDGVTDNRDAAPGGNLHVSVHIRSVNLKSDKQFGGGAELYVEATQGQASADRGPEAIDSGENQLDWTLDLDVDDAGSGFVEALGGAHADGVWEKPITLQFWHDGPDGEPIEVRSSGDDNRHVLRLTYDAFDDRWTGHAEGGTSSGSDADVTIDLSSRVE